MPLTGETTTLLAVAALALYTLVTAASTAIDRLLRLAENSDVAAVLVGATVLAVGTSLPELSAHVVASLGILSGVFEDETTSAIVVGATTGSSTFQVFVLVSVLLIGYGSVTLTPAIVREGFLPMLAAGTVTAVLARDGTVDRLDGLATIGLSVAHVAVTVRRRERTRTLREPPSVDPRRDAAVAIGALALVIASASLVRSVVEGPSRRCPWADRPSAC